MSVWSRRRQTIYLTAVSVIILTILVGGFYWFKSAPTCFDGKQNGNETGVDCGGSCERVCLVGVLPVKISWVRVFSVYPGSYYVVALVENPNLGIGIKNLPYTIRLTDEEGLLVTFREGNTFVNSREKFIIFEGGIDTGERRAARASITFGSNFDWQRLALEKPSLLIEKRSFTNTSRPTLEISVTNDSIYDLRDIKLPVILSDRYGNAFAGSSTVIDRLAKSETKTIIFTWPAPFTELPTAIDVYPRVNLFNLP